MNKVTTNSYKGMNQDLSQSKFPNEFYFEGKNIRIVATDTQSTGSVTNAKGNSLIITIPDVYINHIDKQILYNDTVIEYTTDEINSLNNSLEQVIIGHSTNRNYIVLFTTDNNGFDCIWTLSYDTFELTLKYVRNLNFNSEHLIQVINNFENEKIDKVYWVDGNNQMRYINLKPNNFKNHLNDI